MEALSYLADAFSGRRAERLVLRRTVATGTTVEGLLQQLAREFPEFGRLALSGETVSLDAIAVVVGDQALELAGGWQRPLRDGDLVVLLPAFSGGAAPARREPPAVRVLAGTGFLGTGFAESSLQAAMAQGPDVIGVDAGSTDPGPFYLGAGAAMVSRAATMRDLRLLLRAARAADIPLLVGSAGTGGGEPHLQWTREIVHEIARQEGLRFRMALIHAEIPKPLLAERLRQGKVQPLEPAPELTPERVLAAERFVGLMGPEPYQQALQGGARVVLAGRSSDTSIYAAVPLMRGLPPGPVWHAAKILECGAACVDQRLYPDCMLAIITPDYFDVIPPNAEMRCTPVSVLSHTLYENVNPYELHEPGGTLLTNGARYTALDPRSVRVVGSRFQPGPHTVKIEGAERAGYRSLVIGGIRDPLVLHQLEPFLAAIRTRVEEKVAAALPHLGPAGWSLQFRVYGRDGCMGPLEPTPHVTGHEVGLVIEVLAREREDARAILPIAWHTALHQPVPGWSGLVSNISFPYSPPDIDQGPVYRFCANHLLDVADPCELFPVEYEEVG